MDTPIRRFKQSRRLTYRQLAALLGISHDYARKLGCGSVRTLSPRLARQIEKRTGGQIRAVELVFPERAPRNTRAMPPASAARSTSAKSWSRSCASGLRSSRCISS